MPENLADKGFQGNRQILHEKYDYPGFQSAHVRRHDLARVAAECGLTLADSQVMIGAVHAIGGCRPKLRLDSLSIWRHRS